MHLNSDELRRYTSSVLRFVPMEVAMRYYTIPIAGDNGLHAYADLRHDASGQLGDQGYEHPFDVN